MMTNPRYTVTTYRDAITGVEVDTLRVEMDDTVAGTTSVAVIPVCDIEKAIAQYKSDRYAPHSRVVRITNDPDKIPCGYNVYVTDAKTGQAIENIGLVSIILQPDKLNVAILTRWNLERRVFGIVLMSLLIGGVVLYVYRRYGIAL